MAAALALASLAAIGPAWVAGDAVPGEAPAAIVAPAGYAPFGGDPSGIIDAYGVDPPGIIDAYGVGAAPDGGIRIAPDGRPGPLDAIFAGWRDDTAAQMRIERHIIIRIAPRPPEAPRFLFGFPRPDTRIRMIEHKMGDCIDTASIAGMIPDQDQRLILYMRNSDMVSVMLERACQARDFYSGFYFNRQPDGKLCVGRDTLLSRNGANCRLTRVRRLSPSPP